MEGHLQLDQQDPTPEPTATTSLKIERAQVDIAIDIMREAATWLAEKGMPLWEVKDLNREALLKDCTADDFYVAWLDGHAVAAMILKWHDPLFWETIDPYQSGFIHKLSVRRAYAGKGIPAEMIQSAEKQCLERNIQYLRLDCDYTRASLCSYYERQGFIAVGKKELGPFHIGLYEKKIVQ